MAAAIGVYRLEDHLWKQKQGRPCNLTPGSPQLLYNTCTVLLKYETAMAAHISRGEWGKGNLTPHKEITLLSLKYWMQFFAIRKTFYNFSLLSPWFMEPRGSLPDSQELSNNPYPESNQSRASNLNLFI